MKEAKSKIEGAADRVIAEKRFYDSLEIEIQNNYRSSTKHFIHQLLSERPSVNRLHVLLGMAYAKERKFDSSLQQYNLAMTKFETPYALQKRGRLFMQMRLFDAAIRDYRMAFSMNKDYSRDLAECFTFLNQSDSAKKYWQIYRNSR